MSLLRNENLMYECYERLFLIIISKCFSQIENGNNLIEKINSIIMNFFNNSNVSLSIISLIKIILNYKSSTDDNAQVCSIAIKGLNKFKDFIFKLSNHLDMNKIFVSLYNFFLEFEKTNENLIPHNLNEANSLSMMNSIINEFIKVYGEKIWNFYDDALNNDMKRNDVYFKRSIQLKLRELKNNDFLLNNEPKDVQNLINKNTNKTLTINIIKGNEKNNIDTNIKEKDIDYYVLELKEKGKIMSDKERNNIYKEIISLLKKNNESITSLSGKLGIDYYGKIYEQYHSDNQKESPIGIKKNINNYKPITSLSNDSKKKLIQNNNKTSSFMLTEQAKRIQEYKNKFNYLTDKSNSDNNQVDIFANKNNFFNFKGNVNDENKHINNNVILINNNNNNIILDLEIRKKHLDELSKGNVNNSKSLYKSDTDFPKINQSFFTSNTIGSKNNNQNFNNNNNYFHSQGFESILDMQRKLKAIRSRVENEIEK